MRDQGSSAHDPAAGLTGPLGHEFEPERVADVRSWAHDIRAPNVFFGWKPDISVCMSRRAPSLSYRNTSRRRIHQA